MSGQSDSTQDIEFIEPPLIKEIIEQQRMILEMHKKILEQLMHPPVWVKYRQ